MLRTIYSIILIIACTNIHANEIIEIPKSSPVPGGMAIVPIPYSGEKAPNVKFGGDNVPVFNHKGKWLSAVGLGLDIVPGKYILTINQQEQEGLKTVFRVAPLPASRSQRTVTLSGEFSELEFFIFEFPDESDLEISSTDSDEVLEVNFAFNQIINSGSYIPYGRIIKDSEAKTLINHPWITYITSSNEIVRAPSKSLVERIFLSKNSGITVILRHGRYIKSIINNLEDIILNLDQLSKVEKSSARHLK